MDENFSYLKELVGDKDALICNVKTLNECIEALSFHKEDISLIKEIAYINSIFIKGLIKINDSK